MIERTLPASPAPAPTPPTGRIRLLGQVMDLVTPGQVLDHVAEAVAAGRRSVVANHNLNSLNLVRDQAAMRAFYGSADLVQIDSTPLIAFGRMLGHPVSRAHRSTYLDWRDAFWRRAAERGWRVFYLGGTAKVGAEAVRRLSALYPGARVGSASGYFDPENAWANGDVLKLIAAFRPDVLMVGMGMPRQEAWIARNLSALPACVILNVGAAFDYEAGVQKAAPRWMGRAGIEWLYRLAHDPRRLFRRYCIEPWRLAGPALADIGAALSRGRGQTPSRVLNQSTKAGTPRSIGVEGR
ncbi:MAG: WecB/TagA/CpsF family glycosyltransferase [Brevundimonas sp.]|uniref:WecB/TagA/CpsF family glycosyltransferase n=1 Tax=Brevundimonas sp. TaxID=1871086 RepID=UPI0025BF7083|nr:WecB/TagA/CpsF family glycosyltransferase [Brevundimonas sp.]MBX3478688.1 WecB/TagA/CpsF family glycosyltransferase [Brevundimonas sp.]